MAEAIRESSGVIESDFILPEVENQEYDKLGEGAKAISPIALAILLLAVKADNIEDGQTARQLKRELQERVKDCNASVVKNLNREGHWNTWLPLIVLASSMVISVKIDSQTAQLVGQIATPLITGGDQLLFMTEKERNDRLKQMTDQELQGSLAQAQQARDSFNQDLKRSIEAIINS